MLPGLLHAIGFVVPGKFSVKTTDLVRVQFRVFRVIAIQVERIAADDHGSTFP